MVAYRKVAESEVPPAREPEPRRRLSLGARPRKALSHDLLHDVSPEEFDREARTLAEAEALTPETRARLEAQLIERLKTPVDTPSWGPDWVRKGERTAPRRKGKPGGLLGILARSQKKPEPIEEAPRSALSMEQQDDAHVIARNLEKSRQVHHYRWLYVAALIFAVGVAVLAMFVDYQIIRGDVWTRALSNEFMVVPASLQDSVVFKSLQVVFAVMIVHFFLKITGAYGRNGMIVTAFILAIAMIGSLGYLVAYNNMSGATSATLERSDQALTQQNNSNSIDALLSDEAAKPAAPESKIYSASMTDGVSLPLPKLSQNSLADADSFLWLVFASVVFFIVTVVAALYLQSGESNVRNFVIANDYKHRRRHFAQLHLLELADKRQNARAG